MLGIDILGLALAIFPVVVAIVDSYNVRVTGREIYLLSQSLRNRERIFLNAIEELLSPIVTKTELLTLLEKPDGDLWKNQNLSRKLVSFLGSRQEELFETAQLIVETAGKLKEKLPPLTDPIPASHLVNRGKKVIKIFVRGPSHKASLERLRSLVDDFCTLAEQGRRLAPFRRAARKPFGKLRLLQDRARELHQALLEGWDCDCFHPHPARLRLDVWHASPDEDAKESARFRFLFTVECPTPNSMPEQQWRYAEIIPLETSGARRDSLVSPDGSNHDISPTSPTSASSSPSTVRGPWPIKAPTGSIYKSQSQVRFSVPARPEYIEAQKDQDQDHGVHITNLCEFLKNIETASEPHGTCLGYLEGLRGEKFGVYRAGDQASTSSPVLSTHLGDLYSRSCKKVGTKQSQNNSGFARLTTADRVQLALTLGWNVLQLHSTPWLEKNWHKEDITLIASAPNTLRPYVTHGFPSSRRNSIGSNSQTLSLVSSGERKRLTKWVRDEALFTLGVVLIELCRGQSIRDLAEQEEEGFEFLTAMRLSKNLEGHFGVKYEDAVKACLIPNFSSEQHDPTRGIEQFQAGMYESVIQPLEEAVAVHVRA